MANLTYARDASGGYVGSPFDRFLLLNRLPRQPDPGESSAAYAGRLREAVNALAAPNGSTTRACWRSLTTTTRSCSGPRSWPDCESFSPSRRPRPTASDDELARGGIGNCASCHAPPDFTDFGFHNNGAAQAEYDAVAGPGAFAALMIPTLDERRAAPERYLPPSAAYPNARGPFRQAPSPDHPGEVDLGLWNVFANDAIPGPQATLPATIRRATGAPADASAADLLPLTVALFKTATVRDLGQSPPYFHTGAASTVEEVIAHYRVGRGARPSREAAQRRRRARRYRPPTRKTSRLWPHSCEASTRTTTERRPASGAPRHLNRAFEASRHVSGRRDSPAQVQLFP